MATEIPVSDLKEQEERLSGRVAAGRAKSNDDELSVLDLLIVLAEGKRTIFGITAGFAIVALVVSLLLPIRYTATATLLTPQQNSSLSTQLASQLGSLGGAAALAAGAEAAC